MKPWLFVFAIVGGLSGCESASEVDLLMIPSVGTLTGFGYLDDNGNGTFDDGETVLQGVEVLIGFPGNPTPTATTVTDSAGVFTFQDLTSGEYELSVAADVLADTLEIVDRDPPTISIGGVDTASAVLGVSYPTVLLADVFTLPEGRPVFTHGIALNERDPAGDGVVHFAEGPNYLRAVDVIRTSIGPGDSTRVFGRTLTPAFGRTVLETVTPFVLISRATVVQPNPVTTAGARNANGGALDAALVVVEDALIEVVTDLGQGAYRLRVDDGAGDLEVEIAANLSVNPADLVVGNQLTRGIGLLRPAPGLSEYRLHPRNTGDLTIEIP